MQELCSCKNKFLFNPSSQNVTTPQHVDQKRVKDVTHNNTTCNKESLMSLSLAAPLICCPLRLAKSFSWHAHRLLLFPSCLVGCCVIAWWPPSASQPVPPPLVVPSVCWLPHGICCDTCHLGIPPPLITPLHIFAVLHLPLVWLVVVSRCPEPWLSLPLSLRRHAPLGVWKTMTMRLLP